MNFYQSPYQNLEKILPADVDYFSPCYPDYDEGPCTLPIRERIDLVFSGIQQFPDACVLSRAVQGATEKILREWIVDEASMIQVYGSYLSRCILEHPDAAFGRRFTAWGRESARPYGSCGSGAAVRAGIIGAMHEDIDVVMTLARASAMPTHNHPAGVRGAMVTAVLVWMALHGADKQEMEHYLLWNYPNSFRDPEGLCVQTMPEGMKDELCPSDIHGGTSLRELILYGEHNETYGKICQYTVPEAVINYLYSDSLESCLKNAEKYPCDREAVKAVSAQIAAVWYGLNRKIS